MKQLSEGGLYSNELTQAREPSCTGAIPTQKPKQDSWKHSLEDLQENLLTMLIQKPKSKLPGKNTTSLNFALEAEPPSACLPPHQLEV